MGISEQDAIKELQTRDAVFVAYSQATGRTGTVGSTGIGRFHHSAGSIIRAAARTVHLIIFHEQILSDLVNSFPLFYVEPVGNVYDLGFRKYTWTK